MPDLEILFFFDGENNIVIAGNERVILNLPLGLSLADYLLRYW